MTGSHVRTAGTVFLSALAVSGVPWTAAARQGGTAAHWVVAEDRSGIEVEASFPEPVFVLHEGVEGPWAEARVTGAPSPERFGSPLLPEYTVLLAVPAGTVPRMDPVEIEEQPVGVEAPPGVPARGPGEPETVVRPFRGRELGNGPPVLPAEVQPLGVARHVNLARLVLRPARFLPDSRRWVALRRARVRVWFAPSGEDLEEDSAARGDAMDEAIGASVANPSALSVSLVSQPSSAGGSPRSDSIPEPEPSVMAPLKILVRKDGLYRVTRADLLAAGVDPTGVDPATFVLTNRGVEVPIEVTGASDGSFDAGDAIRFYGQAIGGEETWDNVYRLTGGVRSGLRMAARDATPMPTDPVPSQFRDESYRETNSLYWGSLPDSVESPWFWDKLAVATPGVPVYVDRTLTVANVSAAAATARLEVRVQSRRETPGASPNHHVRIYLNGHLVDDRSWTGLKGVTLGADVPHSWVLEGTNTVRIENPADLGLATQEEWTDWIRLFYFDRYVAESDSLEFGADAAGPWRFEVTGFTGSDLLVYDIADPAQPVLLTGVEARLDGSSWTAVFSDPATALPARYVALRAGAAEVPQGFVRDEPSDLRAQAAWGADILLIAHDSFHAAAQRLANHRRDEGFRVVTARLTDVYDEFNGGIAETRGLKNFVEWAFFNYAPPAPAYLVLVGDGTYDPMDFKGNGDNYVPARQFRAPGFGLAPTDTWYAAVNGADDVPDLAVGRISVRSAAQLDTYLDNLLGYENAPPAASLNSRLLYVADDDDTAFEAVLEDLIARFQPPAMESRRVYLRNYPQTSAGVDQATADIRSAINAGSLITAYMGHGGRTIWADEGLWVNGDVSSLAPGDLLTFVLALNCVNGYFMNLDVEPYSLGEEWSRWADRGAVGNWAPSASGTLFNYDKLSDEFFRHVFELRETRLGRAVWRALVEANAVHNVGIEYVRQMVYFGDPAALLPLDSDRDGRLDLDEMDAGTSPDDTDSDDDGVLDGEEPLWNADTDGDGLANAADHDADDDGLPDGLEMGVTSPSEATDVSRGRFTPDADPATTTDPLDADTDGGGAPDGAEDRNANGAAEAGETDPRLGADDPACAATAPPEVRNLRVDRSGADLSLSWDGLEQSDPCILYRLYVAREAGVPDSFSDFDAPLTATRAAWTHLGAAGDGSSYHYLVSAISPIHGEGPLGHYGR